MQYLNDMSMVCGSLTCALSVVCASRTCVLIEIAVITNSIDFCSGFGCVFYTFCVLFWHVGLPLLKYFLLNN